MVKNKNIRKILISFGSISLTALPVVSVISCDNKDTSNHLTTQIFDGSGVLKGTVRFDFDDNNTITKVTVKTDDPNLNLEVYTKKAAVELQKNDENINYVDSLRDFINNYQNYENIVTLS